MAKHSALSTEVETTAPAKGTAPTFTVKRVVTLPVLKIDVGQEVYFRFTEKMRIGKQVEEDKDAAIIANGINLATGEVCQLLVPAVVQGILHDEYGAPKFGTVSKGAPVSVLEGPADDQAPDSYVGKAFMILKRPKMEGKRYFPFDVAEIEVTE